MPVYKFKTFEEAREALWDMNPGKEYYKALSGFFELYGKLYKKKFPHGIFKFKTLEEAQKQREKI